MAMAPRIELQLTHPKSRLDGITDVRFSNCVVTFHAARPLTCYLVIKSMAPLHLESASNAEAKLRPGWDGTLGRACYGLELKVAAAGEVTARMDAEPAPTQVATASATEINDFLMRLRERPSRFPDSPGEFVRWRAAYRLKLASLLMNGGMPPRVPLEAKLLGEENRKRYRLQTIQYRSHKDQTNVALLSLPRDTPRAPLLLALHGHEAEWGKADIRAFQTGQVDDFCAWFAERGWAVLQPPTMNHLLQHQGWTLIGEWAWDAMTALDYATGLAEVDAGRIATCGLSTGAHIAMTVLALDDRVRAGVVACILSTWHHTRTRLRIPPSCECGISFQLADHLEQCDWAALAAAKPVQFQFGKLDAVFCPGADPSLVNLDWHKGVMPQAEYDAVFAEIERAYKLCGNNDRVTTHYHPGEHRVDNQAAWDWISRWV